MPSNSKDLLHLEAEGLPVESKLLFFNGDDGVFQSPNSKPDLSDKKPNISSVPKSLVLGKIKDFLGVVSSEDNRKLELESKSNPGKYDIEALTGEESEVIEMDLMLGVADLHTPEAVAAAESALASYQPVINLATSDNETESEDSSDEEKEAKPKEKDSKKSQKRKRQSENRANIVELS